MRLTPVQDQAIAARMRHISTIAGGILKRDVPIVMVLPQKLKRECE